VSWMVFIATGMSEAKGNEVWQILPGLDVRMRRKWFIYRVVVIVNTTLLNVQPSI
jgi:hypothetical protein